MKSIAVFGYNRLSVEVINRLQEDNYNLIVIDPNDARIALAAENGLMTANIDFRSDKDLKSIGLGRQIDTLFCFFLEDSENVFLILSARALDQNLNIISLIENQTSADKLLAAGANKIIDPYQICGRKIYDLIKNPQITHIVDQTVFGRQDLNVNEIVIPDDSFLENSYTSQLKLNDQYNLILIGVVDKELGENLYFSLGEKDHLLNAGDILVVLGPSRAIRIFKEELKNVKKN